VAVLHASCAGAGDETPVREPQDVILISVDTLRPDHTSLLGYQRDTTPYLKRLAEESLVLERAYSTDSWTLTAHMSMLTGFYPEQHAVVTKRDVLAPSVPTLAERLRDAGYHTVGLYFSGWIHPYFGFDRGFDVFEKHRTAEEAEKHLARVMAERPPDKPLFLFLHLFDAHNTPMMKARPLYDTPEPFASEFLPDALDRVAGLDNTEIWEGSSAGVTPEQHEALVALYDGGIRYVDAKLEKWIEGWRASGLLDSSLLVITADHGEGLNQRKQRYGGHGGFNEEGLHIPLLVRFPDGRFPDERGRGERNQQPVSIVDIVPTILDAAALAPDRNLPGHPLHAPAADRLLFAQRDGQEAFIQWPHKLIRGRSGGMQYFDLQRDPGELDGVEVSASSASAEPAALLGRVEEEKASWHYPGTSQAGERDPELDARLKALGYAGEDEEE
jgi:arylsulfatase A-like enzyme